MAEIAFFRRARLSSNGHPAVINILRKISSVLFQMNWLACTRRADVDQAERLLKLSERELADIGLSRSDIHAYIFERTG